MDAIPIIFENDQFVVINKPAGVGVHQENEQIGIVTMLQHQLSVPQLWLVHRLDKVTSGLLILAKTSQVAAQLGERFALRQIQKYYLALSDKKPKKKQGSVIGDMRKIRDGKWALSQSKENPAATQFFSCGTDVPGLRFFIIKPHTGKTHQIRVMLKSLGSPILGDNLYTGTDSDRTYLHAYQLKFELASKQFEFSCRPVAGKHFLGIEKQSTVVAEYFEPECLRWPSINLPSQTR